MRKASEIQRFLGISSYPWDEASAGAFQQSVPSEFPGVLHNVPSASPLTEMGECTMWNRGKWEPVVLAGKAKAAFSSITQVLSLRFAICTEISLDILLQLTEQLSAAEL